MKFTPEEAVKTQRGRTDVPLSINYLGATLGSIVSATPRPLYPRERDPVPVVKEAMWAPGPVLTGMESRNSPFPSWVPNPDRSARRGVAVRTALFWPPRKNEACFDTKLHYTNRSPSLRNIFVRTLI